MSGWEQHVNVRGNPAVEGQWDGTPWAFYSYDEQLPDNLAIDASMCVPVCSLDPYNPQVMLTIQINRGHLEIPGGHRERLGNGAWELSPITALRERGEETGLHVATNPLICYGYIEARNAPGSVYSPLSYMQFFAAYTPEHPGLITDPEVDGAGVFTHDALHRMTERGLMRITELGLTCLGIRAVFRHYGISDEYIKMP